MDNPHDQNNYMWETKQEHWLPIVLLNMAAMILFLWAFYDWMML